MANEVILLDLWASPFGIRVRIALAKKGIKYEKKEEDLSNKSSLLLEKNPVYKQIPVLIHNGNAICESLIAVQYIDEVWNDKSSPLLPSDPYLRSQARFWGDYVEKKIYEQASKIIWKPKGEDQEAGKKGLMEFLKVLERELGDKTYFGGETFGYVDIALVPFSSWFYSFGKFADLSIEEQVPKLVSWAEMCLKKESVAKSLPDPLKIYDFLFQRRKKLGIE